MRLDDVRYEYERHDYTFFEMLGDFGGFIDGLTLIAYGLTKSYSKNMFKGSFLEKFPVFDRQSTEAQAKSQAREKLRNGQNVQKVN